MRPIWMEADESDLARLVKIYTLDEVRQKAGEVRYREHGRPDGTKRLHRKRYKRHEDREFARIVDDYEARLTKEEIRREVEKRGKAARTPHQMALAKVCTIFGLNRLSADAQYRRGKPLLDEARRIAEGMDRRYHPPFDAECASYLARGRPLQALSNSELTEEWARLFRVMVHEQTTGCFRALDDASAELQLRKIKPDSNLVPKEPKDPDDLGMREAIRVYLGRIEDGLEPG